MRPVMLYFALINILSFLLFGVDKWKAKRGEWRISENTLLLTALLGGAMGAWLGMRMFHHKTRKPKFYITVPLCVLIWCGVLLYFFL